MSNLEMFVRALDSIRNHLTEHPVDLKIASVTADAFDGGLIDVHLARCDLAELASGLLAWADTLTDVSVAGWRFRYGDNVALRLIGELPNTNATWIEIFGAFTYIDTIATTIGPEVHRDNHLHLTLDHLRSWAVAP